jgi:hypothetical protein
MRSVKHLIVGWSRHNENCTAVPRRSMILHNTLFAVVHFDSSGNKAQLAVAVAFAFAV